MDVQSCVLGVFNLRKRNHHRLLGVTRAVNKVHLEHRPEVRRNHLQRDFHEHFDAALPAAVRELAQRRRGRDLQKHVDVLSNEVPEGDGIVD